MAAAKRIRIIKKIREASGHWRFVSLKKAGNRYVWDPRGGNYFVEWWDGRKRCRQVAGKTPSEAMESQRQKRNELAGEALLGGKKIAAPVTEGTATLLADATQMFLQHVRVHSPDKPGTVRRYTEVLDHVGRILGGKTFVESISRADIDDYKSKRSAECSKKQKERTITPRTVNYEVSVLRTFFYFLIRERSLPIKNPCANFKQLKDPRSKAKRRPPVYQQAEIDRILGKCDAVEKATFATLLLTGLREQELCYLTWADVDIKKPDQATIRVSGEGKDGFSPKDYEERYIPVPRELAVLLGKLFRTATWVFPAKNGNPQTHLLRRLKEIAEAAKVSGATLHKFRHTYATRLLESGCDIVTVQRLMGHSSAMT